MNNNLPCKPAKPGFPAKESVLRRALARDDTCPECGYELDTGWECNNCGYDARDEAYPPDSRAADAKALDCDREDEFTPGVCGCRHGVTYDDDCPICDGTEL